jgi:hypothetical protein
MGMVLLGRQRKHGITGSSPTSASCGKLYAQRFTIKVVSVMGVMQSIAALGISTTYWRGWGDEVIKRPKVLEG